MIGHVRRELIALSGEEIGSWKIEYVESKIRKYIFLKPEGEF